MGNADRSCYDLEQHSNATGVKLLAEKKLDKPVCIFAYVHLQIFSIFTK